MGLPLCWCRDCGARRDTRRGICSVGHDLIVTQLPFAIRVTVATCPPIATGLLSRRSAPSRLGCCRGALPRRDDIAMAQELVRACLGWPEALLRVYACLLLAGLVVGYKPADPHPCEPVEGVLHATSVLELAAELADSRAEGKMRVWGGSACGPSTLWRFEVVVLLFLLLWPVRDCCCCVACMASVVARRVLVMVVRLALDLLAVVSHVWRTVASKSRRVEHCDTCLWLLSAWCWLVVSSGEVLLEFFSVGSGGSEFGVVLNGALVVLVEDYPLSLLAEVLPKSALCSFRATVVLPLWLEAGAGVAYCALPGLRSFVCGFWQVSGEESFLLARGVVSVAAAPVVGGVELSASGTLGAGRASWLYHYRCGVTALPCLGPSEVDVLSSTSAVVLAPVWLCVFLVVGMLVPALSPVCAWRVCCQLLAGSLVVRGVGESGSRWWGLLSVCLVTSELLTGDSRVAVGNCVLCRVGLALLGTCGVVIPFGLPTCGWSEEEGHAWCPGVVELAWSEEEVANLTVAVVTLYPVTSGLLSRCPSLSQCGSAWLLLCLPCLFARCLALEGLSRSEVVSISWDRHPHEPVEEVLRATSVLELAAELADSRAEGKTRQRLGWRAEDADDASPSWLLAAVAWLLLLVRGGSASGPSTLWRSEVAVLVFLLLWPVRDWLEEEDKLLQAPSYRIIPLAPECSTPSKLQASLAGHIQG
ncbi:hypothetical protein Taro_015347 [Colocasia esculenta]|uniref:Uncharacterized protein n=1 Tax=Colocasia esculenta TaxID=4460 RepID=A0A843UB93_COLES|nr:hypothetical protein [Colocasia esculenta]